MSLGAYVSPAEPIGFVVISRGRTPVGVYHLEDLLYTQVSSSDPLTPL